MHDDCKIFVEALVAATEAVKQTNEVNKRLYKLFIFTVVVIVLLVLTRDYIQYTSSYDYPKAASQTNVTENKGE